MAFPDIFDPTEPNPNNVVATDVSKITQNFQALADLFGLPVAPQAITGAAFSIMPNGAVAFAQGGATIPVDPAAGSSIANRQYVDSFIEISNNGSGSAFTANYPGITAYQFGHRYTFFPLNTANGNDTVSLNGLAAIPLFKTIPGLGNQRTVPGDFLANQVLEAVFDGQNFQMTGFIGVSHGFQLLSAPSANYTVPGGISTIIIEIYGGSGGGGGGAVQPGPFNSGGGGGGGGAKTKVILAVTPGQSIPYICGAAGVGGAPGSAGGNGGFSEFNNQFSAFGGFGGAQGLGSPGAGGAGALAQVPGFGWIENIAGLSGAGGSGTSGGVGAGNFQPGGAGGNVGTSGSTGFQGYIIVWF